MPCNSDHMKAHDGEIEMSRIYCLIEEINGHEIELNDWDGYHKLVYCRLIDTEERDKAIKTLCDWLKEHGADDYSYKMKEWWEEHQKIDKAKEEN